MKWVIDRIEGDYAVAGCGDIFFDIPKSALPKDICEGDILEICINSCETENRKEKLKHKLNNLFGE